MFMLLRTAGAMGKLFHLPVKQCNYDDRHNDQDNYNGDKSCDDDNVMRAFVLIIIINNIILIVSIIAIITVNLPLN